MRTLTNINFKKLIAALAFATLGFATALAQAAPDMGGPNDPLFGCDVSGACSITLDEQGNISGSFGGFFGPYDVTLTHIASTVDPSFVDNLGNPLEVTSYEVVGKGGIAALQLTPGALGLCEVAVAVDGSACISPTGDEKGDVLIFTPLGIDAGGFGHSRIDFLSDNESTFSFATGFNVLEVGSEGSNGAFYQAHGASAELIDYHIISDTPEPSTWLLFSSGLAGLAFWRRKRA